MQTAALALSAGQARSDWPLVRHHNRDLSDSRSVVSALNRWRWDGANLEVAHDSKPLTRVMDCTMLVIRINVMMRCFRQHHAFPFVNDVLRGTWLEPRGQPGMTSVG